MEHTHTVVVTSRFNLVILNADMSTTAASVTYTQKDGGIHTILLMCQSDKTH